MHLERLAVCLHALSTSVLASCLSMDRRDVSLACLWLLERVFMLSGFKITRARGDINASNLLEHYWSLSFSVCASCRDNALGNRFVWRQRLRLIGSKCSTRVVGTLWSWVQEVPSANFGEAFGHRGWDFLWVIVFKSQQVCTEIAPRNGQGRLIRNFYILVIRLYFSTAPVVV